MDFWVGLLAVSLLATTFAAFAISRILAVAIFWFFLSKSERERVDLGRGSDGTLTRLWALSKEKTGTVRTLIRVHVVLAWAVYIQVPIMLIAVFIHLNL